MSVFERIFIYSLMADAYASKQEVESWFDAEGRLVEEGAMRRTLFEGKVMLSELGPSFVLVQLA